ncbi:hypothetical protein FO519_000211 [Halicephalobus sp. NKZ332]|nr:hypothetical protein FO519_000211 [Halicephalobus sp. NKZ332]
MAEKGSCAICDAPSHGLHFGVSTCKACASFFRRSMVERKRYKCRFQNNCIINNHVRNQCRSCRLRKCYNSGMGLPDMKAVYPLMDRMLAAFRSFQESLKSLYKVENPHIPGLPEEFRQIKIFRPFAVRFSILYRVYMSALYFDKEGDERICTHYGYYNSLATLHLFFGDIPEIADAKALAVPVFTKVNQVKRKAIRIGLREIDVAALMGIFFVTEIEDLVGLDDQNQKYKSDLQNELFHNIISNFGFERAGTQLAEILGLMVDINMLCVVSTESMILEDLVLPKNKLLQTYLYVDPRR